MKTIAILGGGPAGVGAAWWLRRRGLAEVVLLEQREQVGGNAGSFDWNGHRLDFGSHRLHPSCDPAILDELRARLGADLLDRPRHGRIRLLGKWVHFPLGAGDLLLHLDKRFALGAARDVVSKVVRRGKREPESFAQGLEQTLGRTICRHFYFPYAGKIWGLDPAELSAIQAKKRVSANSFGRLFRKIAGQLPGLKKPGAGRFFYPRGGFGQISESLAAAAREAGAELRLGTAVHGLEAPASDAAKWRVRVRRNGAEGAIDADFVWSTLPLPAVAERMSPRAPADVIAATGDIMYRAMILVYLELPVDRFSEYDAHYFPEAGITITRLSEPKNYAVRSEPRGRTVLCAELPCAVGDRHWSASDEELGRIVAADLERAGIPVPAAPVAVATRRLPQAYPIYRKGYERPFGVLDRWADGLPRFLTYGRQGLFAHDNTHHALAMAHAAVSCFDGGRFDHDAWRRHREVFATHVVED